MRRLIAALLMALAAVIDGRTVAEFAVEAVKKATGDLGMELVDKNGKPVDSWEQN